MRWTTRNNYSSNAWRTTHLTRPSSPPRPAVPRSGREQCRQKPPKPSSARSGRSRTAISLAKPLLYRGFGPGIGAGRGIDQLALALVGSRHRPPPTCEPFPPRPGPLAMSFARHTGAAPSTPRSCTSALTDSPSLSPTTSAPPTNPSSRRPRRLCWTHSSPSRGATFRLVLRPIDMVLASPEMLSAAHALVDILWAVHTTSGL